MENKKPEDIGQLAGVVLSGLGKRLLVGKQGDDPGQTGPTADPEDLAAWAEGTLRGSRKRGVERLLRASPAARAQLAEYLNSVRGTRYGDALLSSAARGSSPFSRLLGVTAESLDLLSVKFALPRPALALGAMAVLIVVVGLPMLIYDRGRPERILSHASELARAGRWSEAQHTFDKAISRTRPDSPLHGKALAMAAGTRVWEARAAGQRYPEFGVVTSLGGKARSRDFDFMGDTTPTASMAPFDKALVASVETQFRNALKADPGNVVALKGLADLQLEAGTPDAARAILDELSSKKAEDPDTLVLQGRLSVADGHTSDAERLLLQALRIAPEHLAALANLARIYELLGAADKATPLRVKLRQLGYPDELAGGKR